MNRPIPEWVMLLVVALGIAFIATGAGYAIGYNRGSETATNYVLETIYGPQPEVTT